MKLSDHFIARQLRARPRLFIAALIGIMVAFLTPESLVTENATRLVFAWDIGAGLYLVLVGIMISRSSEAQTQTRARLQDDGQFVILALVVLAAVASLGAIIAELDLAKDLHGQDKYAHIALAAFTTFLSWTFTQSMFALHYAHDYYLSSSKGLPVGLEFPGTPDPDYFDFLYFSCVIGTSGQTADVSMTSKPIRRIGLIHCVLAFFFNATLLALMINIAASIL